MSNGAPPRPPRPAPRPPPNPPRPSGAPAPPPRAPGGGPCPKTCAATVATMTRHISSRRVMPRGEDLPFTACDLRLNAFRDDVPHRQIARVADHKRVRIV